MIEREKVDNIMGKRGEQRKRWERNWRKFALKQRDKHREKRQRKEEMREIQIYSESK